MKIQPAKDRNFAIGEADAWREAHRLKLVENQPVGDARVELRNPPDRKDGKVPLVELLGRLKLTIFSLPKEVEPALGGPAIRRALEVCALHKHRQEAATRLNRPALIVYLDEQQKLQLCGRVERYQDRKYRSASKFSTAFKLRKVKVDEHHLATYEL